MGRGSASRLTDQHPDKSHHEIRLYASYKAENWSIHIKTITCNVWNQSKPFKIASNISFDTKNTPKSSNIYIYICINHEKQFLQYQSTRNFTEKKKSDNQNIDLYRKTMVFDEKVGSKWGSPGPLSGSLSGPLSGSANRGLDLRTWFINRF